MLDRCVDAILLAIGSIHLSSLLAKKKRLSRFRWAASILSSRQERKWFDSGWRTTLAWCQWECGQLELAEELYRSAIQEEGSRSASALHGYCWCRVGQALRLATPEALQSAAELCRSLLRHPAFLEWNHKAKSDVRAWLAACISGDDPDQAIDLLREVTKAYPDELFAVSRLGWLLGSQRSYREAAKYLCTAAILAKQRKVSWFDTEWECMLALCLWECGKTDRAETMFRSAIQKEGQQSACTLRTYCDCCVCQALKSREPAQLNVAVALCKRLLDHPAIQRGNGQERATVQARLGRCMAHSNPEGSIELLRGAAEEYPDHPYVLSVLGEVLIGRDRCREAVKWLDKAAALAEYQGQAWFNTEWKSLLATSLWWTGQEARAEEMFRSCIEEEGHRSAFSLSYYYSCRVGQAMMLEKPELFAAAARAGKALLAHPAVRDWDERELVNIRIRLAACLVRTQPAEADSLVRDVATRFQDDAAIIGNLGAMEECRGDWRQAVVYFRKASAIEPHMLWLFHGLGEALCKLSEWRDANEAFSQAIRADYDFRHMCLYGQALCAKGLGDLARAEELARQALEIESGYNLPTALLAEIEQSRREPRKPETDQRTVAVDERSEKASTD